MSLEQRLRVVRKKTAITEETFEESAIFWGDLGFN